MEDISTYRRIANRIRLYSLGVPERHQNLPDRRLVPLSRRVVQVQSHISFGTRIISGDEIGLCSSAVADNNRLSMLIKFKLLCIKCDEQIGMPEGQVGDPG